MLESKRSKPVLWSRGSAKTIEPGVTGCSILVGLVWIWTPRRAARISLGRPACGAKVLRDEQLLSMYVLMYIKESKEMSRFGIKQNEYDN